MQTHQDAGASRKGIERERPRAEPMLDARRGHQTLMSLRSGLTEAHLLDPTATERVDYSSMRN